MNEGLHKIGNLAGVLGALICVSAFFVRFSGKQFLAGYEPLSFFIGGVALMVFGCFLKLEGK